MTRTIIRKYINSLPHKFVEFLIIMELSILEKTIELALNIEANQKIKARKKNQVYFLNTIEKLRYKVYNLQVVQAKPNKVKPVMLVEPLQRTRE